MKNIWNNFYENKILRILVHQPLKALAHILSNGGFHLLMCITVFLLTFFWYQKNVNTSNAQMHNINFDINEKSSPIHDNDTLVVFHISLILDSDSLYKETNNKYRSKMVISYGYDWYANRWIDYLFADSNHAYKEPIDTCELTFYHYPYLNDIYVDADSMIFNMGEKGKYDTLIYKTELFQAYTKDSMLKINVIPSEKNFNQIINIYSNELGLTEGDAYYNYFISLPWFPIATNTKNHHGGQSIMVQVGNLMMRNSFYHNTSCKLTYQFLYPEPDVINNGFLFYNKPETLMKIRNNHGLIIQATDIDAQNKNNRKSIIYSVLVGTGAALFFDILIQIIRELRNVNRKHDIRLRLRRRKEDKDTNEVDNTSNQIDDRPCDEVFKKETDDLISSNDIGENSEDDQLTTSN